LFDALDARELVMMLVCGTVPITLGFKEARVGEQTTQRVTTACGDDARVLIVGLKVTVAQTAFDDRGIKQYLCSQGCARLAVDKPKAH
jgi:hypothetical protein